MKPTKGESMDKVTLIGNTADGRRVQVVKDLRPSYRGFWYVRVEEAPGSIGWQKWPSSSVLADVQAQALDMVGK